MKINTKLTLMILLLTVSVVSIIFILTSIKKDKNIIKSSSFSLENVIPGKTNEKTLLQNLGSPISSSEGSLQYKSNSNTRNNEVKVTDGTVSFVKQIVSFKDNISYTDLYEKYGDSSILYGPDSINGYFLYYQVDRGVAYIANSISNDVLEIWYFTPTTFKTFKDLWASKYSEKYIPQY